MGRSGGDEQEKTIRKLTLMITCNCNFTLYTGNPSVNLIAHFLFIYYSHLAVSRRSENLLIFSGMYLEHSTTVSAPFRDKHDVTHPLRNVLPCVEQSFPENCIGLSDLFYQANQEVQPSSTTAIWGNPRLAGYITSQRLGSWT